MTAGDEGEKFKYTPGPNAVDISGVKDGGVLKEIIKEGEGEVCVSVGNTVAVNCRGSLADGTVITSSTDSKKPFTFVLGQGNVIPAWELAIPTMKKGETAIFTCKPEYAFGKKGLPPKIPPSATLIFEITLLSWEPDDVSPEKDGGILKSIISKGKGYSTPNVGALVEVHLTGSYNGKVFEDRDVTFNLGEGIKFGVIEGIEKALTGFTKEEKADLEIKPKYAFDRTGHKEFGIPPNAVVNYTVEMKNFERAKNTWDMDEEEKISQAKVLKEKATNYFKEGNYTLAAKFYDNSIRYISSDVGFSEKNDVGEEENEREALLLANRLNLGLTYLKLDDYRRAKKECDNALAIDPNNVKGLFRRGQAYLGMNEVENAKEDFETVLELEPSNKLAANQIIICCNKIKQLRQKERVTYANMFEKFARKDRKKEESVEKEPETIKLGEWGKDERDHEPTEFEKKNPDILMLNRDDEFKNM